MTHKRNAFVVLYMLMMIAVISLLSQQLVKSVFVGSQFIKTMVDRERAEMLALSGLELAMAQLAYDEKDDEKQAQDPNATDKDADKKKKKGIKGFLSRLLPHINRWQKYVLHEKTDGIDGSIKFCISCESGKININEAFDFKKMEFKKEYNDLLRGLEMRGTKIPAGEMLTRMVEFLKQRKRKIDDISELLAVPGFQALDIFYRPPRDAAKGKKAEHNADLALQDIFTIWTADDKIDLLGLSDSLCAFFSLRRPLADDAIRRREQFEQFVQLFNKSMVQDFENNWKVFENIYDAKSKVLTQFKNIFTKQFGPKIFSVLSCGKVGHVEQTMLAIIARSPVKKEAQNKQKDTVEKKNEREQVVERKFKVLRVYWL